MAKKIKIMGGFGFVGTNLCRQLALKHLGFEVVDITMSNQSTDYYSANCYFWRS